MNGELEGGECVADNGLPAVSPAMVAFILEWGREVCFWFPRELLRYIERRMSYEPPQAMRTPSIASSASSAD